MIAIFDWDGTLCDSIEHIVSAMQDAASEQGFEPPPAPAVRNIVGLGLPQALAQLFPALDGAEHTELALAYSRHFAAPERGPAKLYEGALATLDGLRARGIELAVATGKSRRGLDRVLSSLGLAGYFDSTRCADETHSKPHPRMLYEIMAARGKSPGDTVMIGDSEYDMDMARQAGVRSVGVSFGVHDSDRLASFGPLTVIDALPELLELSAFGG
ncbi:MAG: HAD-IA family hydrolase [Halioglobus sp.]|nr:HAD-IA family hydrolase [Halioglobus sp.]MBP6725421.1 HAD-IA family hydrolase [Halioglobus sp.]